MTSDLASTALAISSGSNGRRNSAMRALTWDKSARACAGRFSNRAIELRIVLRFALGVVTARMSAMTSHMSPRRHHLLRRMRHKAGQVPPVSPRQGVSHLASRAPHREAPSRAARASKDDPACAGVRARWSVLRGRFAAPQDEERQRQAIPSKSRGVHRDQLFPKFRIPAILPIIRRTSVAWVTEAAGNLTDARRRSLTPD